MIDFVLKRSNGMAAGIQFTIRSFDSLTALPLIGIETFPKFEQTFQVCLKILCGIKFLAKDSLQSVQIVLNVVGCEWLREQFGALQDEFANLRREFLEDLGHFDLALENGANVRQRSEIDRRVGDRAECMRELYSFLVDDFRGDRHRTSLRCFIDGTEQLLVTREETF